MLRLLDTFCGAGGCTKGYQEAGFYVVGVDNRPQPHYCGEEFYQADALEFIMAHGKEYDAIHASPPCQKYSVASWVHINNGKQYPDLIDPVRNELIKTGKPYIIENVIGAPLNNPIVLCGLMFDLKVFRHRGFETSFFIFRLPHPSHNGKRIGEGYFSVSGGAGRWKTWGTVKRNISKGTVKEWRDAMGIDWMTRKEITQAIPWVYTKFIGIRLMNYLQ